MPRSQSPRPAPLHADVLRAAPTVGLLLFMTCLWSTTGCAPSPDDAEAERDALEVRAEGATSAAVDLFVVIGQSNAVGIGQGASTIPPARIRGSELDPFTGALHPISYPTGRRNPYWPPGVSSRTSFLVSFATAWFERTGRQAVMTNAAAGGTALSDTASSTDWTDGPIDSDGLYRNAVTVFEAAKYTLALNGSTINSANFIWLQGETDALLGVSRADYAARLRALIQRFNADVRPTWFFVNPMGFYVALDRSASPPIPDYAATQQLIGPYMAVIQGQYDAPQGVSNARVLSPLATDYTALCTSPSGGYGYTSPACGLHDEVHYKTWLYELLGADMAARAAAVIP